MLCQKVEPIVNGLTQDYQGKIDCKVVKYNEGDSQERIKRYGLDVHGMVITDQTDKVLWSESGHKQTRDGVVAAITKVLGS
jgi:hypothetical protein